MCTAMVNGGFNGYNDRLKYINSAIKALNLKSCAKLNRDGKYHLAESRAYNNAKFSFAWGVWSDPGSTKHGKKKNSEQALIGYKRYLEIYDANAEVRNNTTRTYYAPGRKAPQAKTFAEQRIHILESTQ
ncbi:hypothetical protein D3C78_935650 [compost metagenome]